MSFLNSAGDFFNCICVNLSLWMTSTNIFSLKFYKNLKNSQNRRVYPREN